MNIFNENEQPTTSRAGLLRETQQQVEELVEILSNNVDRALEREHNLTDLNEIGENIKRGANDFRTMAASALKPKNDEKLLKTESEEKKASRENLLEETQQQVDDIVEILFNNVRLALEREHNLLVLNEVGENLERGALDFRDMAAALKRNMWKRRLKTFIGVVGGIGGIGAIILIICK